MLTKIWLQRYKKLLNLVQIYEFLMIPSTIKSYLLPTLIVQPI
jgi:hypothetical protein